MKIERVGGGVEEEELLHLQQIIMEDDGVGGLLQMQHNAYLGLHHHKD